MKLPRSRQPERHGSSHKGRSHSHRDKVGPAKRAQVSKSRRASAEAKRARSSWGADV